MVWCTDLDPLAPIIRHSYPDDGRPVTYDPLSVFRSLLLCQLRGLRNLTDWAAQLRREPTLAILCGFWSGQTPCVGTFYGFLRRMFPQPKAAQVKGIIRQHHRVKKPGHGQKLPPDRRKLARLARWCSEHRTQSPAPTAADLWDQVLTATVAQSIDRGIIPQNTPVGVAGDGSLLRSGAHSHGRKACTCPGRCTCPRYFSDPTARPGYDSTNNCFLLGRAVYVLTETNSGHHLPLTLDLGPANRADSVSHLIAIAKAERLLPITINIDLSDSAHDHDPLYRFDLGLGIEPVFDRHGKLPKPLPAVAQRLRDVGLTLCLHGRPACEQGVLHSVGHSRPGIRQFQCPLRHPDSCPRTTCPFRNGKRFTIDIRLQPRLLARNPQTEPAVRRLYKKRTSVERTFSLLTSASNLDTARHRRDYLWHGRLAITAVLAHARVWTSSSCLSAAAWLRTWAAAA